MVTRKCLDNAIRLKMVRSRREGWEEEESGNIPEPAPPLFLYSHFLKKGVQAQAVTAGNKPCFCCFKPRAQMRRRSI